MEQQKIVQFSQNEESDMTNQIINKAFSIINKDKQVVIVGVMRGGTTDAIFTQSALEDLAKKGGLKKKPGIETFRFQTYDSEGQSKEEKEQNKAKYVQEFIALIQTKYPKESQIILIEDMIDSGNSIVEINTKVFEQLKVLGYDCRIVVGYDKQRCDERAKRKEIAQLHQENVLYTACEEDFWYKTVKSRLPDILEEQIPFVWSKTSRERGRKSGPFTNQGTQTEFKNDKELIAQLQQQLSQYHLQYGPLQQQSQQQFIDKISEQKHNQIKK